MKKVEIFNPNIDKSSRSVISKSSKLISKRNPEEQNQETYCPYFKKDKVGDRIIERTNVSKSQNKQNNQGKPVQTLDRVGKKVSELLVKHQKVKQKLKKMKEESEKQHEQKCPFAPSKGSNGRYHVGGNVIRRNEIWLREKRRKQMQLKQSLTLGDLKQCTFSPNFQSKKMSQSYLKNRSASRSITKFEKTPRKNQNSTLFKSSKRDFTEAEYEMAKRNLISKIMTVIK